VLIVILQNIKPVKIAPKRKKTSKPELFASEKGLIFFKAGGSRPLKNFRVTKDERSTYKTRGKVCKRTVSSAT